MNSVGRVVGLAMPFRNEFAIVDRGLMEQFDAGSLTESLRSGRTVTAFINHCKSAPLGSTLGGELKLWTDRRGLWFSLDLPDIPAGREAARRLSAKELRAASIGFKLLDWRWLPLGKPGSEKVKLITRATLNEVSLAGQPAYGATAWHFRWYPTNISPTPPQTIRSPSHPQATTQTPPRSARRHNKVIETTRRPGACSSRVDDDEIDHEGIHRRRGLLNYLLTLEPPEPTESVYLRLLREHKPV